MAGRGRYQTKQQQAVLLFFASSPEGCYTAEEAYRRLTENGVDMGKTTVYRAITRLCEEGTLRRYAPHDAADAALYQYNSCAGNHLHLRCVACGALEHLHCDEVEAFCQHMASHHGFALDEGQTILYGRCQACVEQGQHIPHDCVECTKAKAKIE